MRTISSRYKSLLLKYSGDKELIELLELVRLDAVREKENYYVTHLSYPEQRDLLGKLEVDLDTAKAYMDNK